MFISSCPLPSPALHRAQEGPLPAQPTTCRGFSGTPPVPSRPVPSTSGPAKILPKHTDPGFGIPCAGRPSPEVGGLGAGAGFCPNYAVPPSPEQDPRHPCSWVCAAGEETVGAAPEPGWWGERPRGPQALYDSNFSPFLSPLTIPQCPSRIRSAPVCLGVAETGEVCAKSSPPSGHH